MSASAAPVPTAVFALAIKDLPVGNLYGKAAELDNSILHLRDSIEQLRPFVEEGDADCQEAVAENNEVIERMLQRLELLKTEVEGRGLSWAHRGHEPKVDGDATVDGLNSHGPDSSLNTPAVAQRSTARPEDTAHRGSQNQTLSSERMETDDGEDEGVLL
ncbi:MAG: hypothetical protein M1815_000475 [Lichina confinis]|nr:MAG: hypothetical protein M1815_000475 [Lichina confinis]